MIIKLVKVFIQLLILLTFIHALGSWFPEVRRSKIYWYIDWIVSPFLEPIRKVVKPINGIDFSPLILILILSILLRILR
ncbi:YggT family protein [Aquifex aeolicus]|uniref:YggT family protein n=1 Tax=Aquifex aeolicus TaxID=63363 RepID=UPI0002D98FA4|nr:YggT family protein [Aquifex aeolicus]